MTRLNFSARNDALMAGVIFWLGAIGWVFLTKLAVGAMTSGPDELTSGSVLKILVFATGISSLLYLLFDNRSRPFGDKFAKHPARDTVVNRSSNHTGNIRPRLGVDLKETVVPRETYDSPDVGWSPASILRRSAARIMGTIQGITDTREIEETLRLQAVALHSAGNAIVITDRNGFITYVNPAFTRLTGYTPDEAIGKTPRILSSGMHDRLFYESLWGTITSGVVWRGHVINRKKGGTLYHEEETITPVRMDGNRVSHFIAIKRDITEQIRSEEAQKSSMTRLQDLSVRLEKVREEERKSLSHEVHDELGQVLTAVKMKLINLEQDMLMHDDAFGTKMRAAILLVDEAMATVRDIAGRLRPGVLDYLGLVAGAEWQIEKFQKASGIKCNFLKPREDLAIDEERSTVLFRILQEALTNVGRHSQATEVEIALSEYEGDLVLSVADNGIGIRKEDIEDPRSFGLLGIRERLRPYGGRCTFRRRAAGGTELSINLPKRR